MDKFLAFLFSFSILNSSFAGELLCPCCYDNYFNNYQDGKSFVTDGLDVYVVDDFTDVKIFNDYYSHFFDKDEEDLFLPKEQYNIDVFSREEEPSNELHFSSHKNPWYWHIYKKNENDDEFNNNLIENIAKKMSTEGGNNFDWKKEVDKFRIFERFRSKVRHNKNVIIIKIKEPNDTLFENTIFTFRKFVNMSYVPVPIIFTGNFDYVDFEIDLKNFNDEYTKEYGGDENNIVTTRGVVDKRQEINSQQCLYIKQDENFVDRVKFELKKASNYHNFKSEDFNGETFNIIIIGLPRSGKSLFTNTILNQLSSKVANDMISVTQERKPFYHIDVENIPIRIIDTPGFENSNKNSVDEFIDSLKATDEKNPDKRKIDLAHVVIYIINAKNFPKPENFGGSWTDSSGRSRGNNFYETNELKLFKLFKEEKVPVVFVIAQSHSFKNGYKYLKKWFGDLALIDDLSNYRANTEEWEAKDQWICPKWTRGSLIQLKNDPIEESDKYTGKYGLVKLMNIIGELFDKNEEYKNRIPKVFANNHNLKDILDKLKEQLITKQGFNDDTKQAPVFDPGIDDDDDNKDIIVREVDNKIPLCLYKLHDAHIKGNFMEKLLISAAEKGMINAFAKGENYSFFGQEINFSNF